MALFDVVIAYPGSWNTETQSWNNNEITFYEISADTEDAAGAVMRTKIDEGAMDASVSYLIEVGGLEAKLADWNWMNQNYPHSIRPIIIKTVRSSTLPRHLDTGSTR